REGLIHETAQARVPRRVQTEHARVGHQLGVDAGDGEVVRPGRGVLQDPLHVGVAKDRNDGETGVRKHGMLAPCARKDRVRVAPGGDVERIEAKSVAGRVVDAIPYRAFGARHRRRHSGYARASTVATATDAGDHASDDTIAGCKIFPRSERKERMQRRTRAPGSGVRFAILPQVRRTTMRNESCPTEEASVSGKSGYERTPRRERTSLSVHDERPLLHRELAAAAAAG